MNLQQSYVPVGLAAHTCETGTRKESNTEYKPVDSPQPEGAGVFRGSEFVQGEQNGQMGVIATTCREGQKGGEK
jgi:hypothetical protein